MYDLHVDLRWCLMASKLCFDGGDTSLPPPQDPGGLEWPLG